MPAYTGSLPTDSGAKKFEGALADNAGSNEFVAYAAANRRTQNGEVVADASMHVTTTSGAGATIGVVGDAAVTTDAAGTLSAKLRGIVVLLVTLLSRWPAAIGRLGAAGSLSTALSTEDKATLDAVATAAGAPSGAAVISDAAGTLQQYLRGLVVLTLDVLGRIGAGTETPPATDTAASGLNGRLQRIAQQLTNVVAYTAPATSGSYDLAVPVTTSATLIKAANAGRKRLTIKNSEPGTEAIIWLGFTTSVTAGKAGRNIGPLYPGESITLAYTGAIYGITSSGTAYAAPAEMS